LRARFVFEADSITNIAHQLGYFHTVASLDVLTAMPARIAAVTLEDVARVAAKYLRGTSCTVGTFKPVIGAEPS
jgi:predicted Zn-dependent peptidase